jgi:hypothetical protein
MEELIQMNAERQNEYPPLNVNKTKKFLSSIGPPAKVTRAQSERLYDLCMVESYVEVLAQLGAPSLCRAIYEQHPSADIREDAVSSLAEFWVVNGVRASVVKQLDLFPFVFGVIEDPKASPGSKHNACRLLAQLGSDKEMIEMWHDYAHAHPSAVLSVIPLLSDRKIPVRMGGEHVMMREQGYGPIAFLAVLLRMSVGLKPEELRPLLDPSVDLTGKLRRLSETSPSDFQRQCESVLVRWMIFSRNPESKSQILSEEALLKPFFPQPGGEVTKPRVLKCGLPTCARSDCKLLKCGRCEERYCSVECQKAHWREHKKECGSAAK